MKKRRTKKPKKKVKRKRAKLSSQSLTEAMDLHVQVELLREQLERQWEIAEKADERIQDLEIHVNLLTRLFTTFCIEKFGMRVGVLKRLIKRIEKEAIRDSQISHLESIYQLDHKPNKSKHSPKDDPWDQIS